MASSAKRTGRMAGRESLARDFRLIFQAVADAFRGMGANEQPDCRCETLHYAGWR